MMTSRCESQNDQEDYSSPSLKVFLMTASGRLHPYKMKTVEDQLILSYEMKGKKIIIPHNLQLLHITSTDTSTVKTVCSDGKHFGAYIREGKAYRKIFFMTFEEMNTAIEFILSAQ